MIHTISKIRVRYAETDRMDIVYHSNYFVWFETARILMLDQIGLPYKLIEKNGLFIPVLEARASYLSPARFDDRLDIHLYMRQKPRVRFYLEYEVKRSKELLVKGSTAHGFMDKNGKGVRPPNQFIEQINAAWNENA